MAQAPTRRTPAARPARDAPPPEPPPPPPAAVSLIPTFGVHTGTLEDRKYRSFNLEVEGKRTPRARTEERWTEELDCFMDIDGGLWVAVGQARTDMDMARALVQFLGANLRDDDGASMDYVEPTLPEREDPDDDESEWLYDDPRDGEEEGQPLYLGWDGELYRRGELPKLDELRDGSSRRRFAYVSDSMRIRYRFEALQEIAEWLTQHLTGRPTQRPVPSGHGPQRTGHGSTARRRGR
jgi:hypothetical protein